jgi:hypothetical protein
VVTVRTDGLVAPEYALASSSSVIVLVDESTV